MKELILKMSKSKYVFKNTGYFIYYVDINFESRHLVDNK